MIGDGITGGFGDNLELPASNDPADASATAPAAAIEPAKAAPVASDISPRYHAAIGQIESSGGTQYGNGGGIYQFIPGTAASLGYTQEQIRAMPPEQQTALNDKFTRQNTALLSKAGVPVNDVTAYMAHQQGAGGAAKLYAADPNAIAADVVGRKNADGNKPFFYGKDGTPLTVQQTRDMFADKVARAGGTLPEGTKTASAAPAPIKTEKGQPTVKERIAAWMQGRNAADTPLSTQAPEPEQPAAEPKEAPEQEPAAQPYTPKPTAPVSGVVRSGGKVYFQRYGRTFDASGNLVG